METEVDIDYLIEIMFEDLGLPWIEEKTKKQQLIPKGWKFESISKKGIMPRIHKKRTLLEAVKRMVMYEAEIMEETGCDEKTAKQALIQTIGDLVEAIEIVKNDQVDKTIEPTIVIEDDDLRYKQNEHWKKFSSFLGAANQGPYLIHLLPGISIEYLPRFLPIISCFHSLFSFLSEW